MTDGRIAIVGAGHAGGSVAALLRQHGWSGPVTLVGEEPVVPYQRPPLSKAFLKGEADGESLKLKADDFYPEQDIALHLGARVTGIDTDCRAVTFENGASLPYDVLILATGSEARGLPIPGAQLHGLHSLRSLADAEAIKAAVSPGGRLAVVGAGYVGLEVAASARALGAEVTVIEREPRVLARVAAEPLSRFFEDYHRRHGVTVMTGAQVASFAGDSHGFVRAVSLADGPEIACDAAIVGVGAAACDALARTAGLACDNGVVVDAVGRTSDPTIFAVGDVTNRPMPFYGDRRFRLESVPNALEQARQLAAHLCGRPAPAPEVPWFWSDQYDLKLQIAGVPFDAHHLHVRGDMSEARFSLWHLDAGGRVLCVEACNAPADFMTGKLWIGRGVRVDPARLTDAAQPVKAAALDA